ncbi:hypothetical protein WAF17_09580 [Bernardetia sp. ABR2-2B]|uniref:hypothetical protein n=1 Tax=Bernardetia sp. ABR2-2B TaxID=3127472 RepID=UPI0030CF2416
MKKQIIILLATLSILTSGCSKEEVQLNRNYWGEVQVLKSGEVWKPFIYARTDFTSENHIYFEIASYDRRNIMREVLNISKVAKKEGYNTIRNIRYNASYYTLGAGGDVICGAYQVDDSVEVAGYVNVTKYDAESGILEGTFEVTLVKDRSCEENAPDTLRFTEGVFYTRVQED